MPADGGKSAVAGFRNDGHFTGLISFSNNIINSAPSFLQQVPGLKGKKVENQHHSRSTTISITSLQSHETIINTHTKGQFCLSKTALVVFISPVLSLSHSSADTFLHPLDYATKPQRSVMQGRDIPPKMCQNLKTTWLLVAIVANDLITLAI